MQYKVTCNHCGQQFVIEAQAGQTVQCTCPFCQQEMVLALPEPVQPAPPPVTTPPLEKKRSGCGPAWILMVICGIVLAMGVVGYVWLRQVQIEQDRKWTERQERARQKAHTDSLMRIRSEQEAQERSNAQQEARHKTISRFIEAFYLKAILTPKGGAGYEHYLTEHCKEKLTDVQQDDSLSTGKERLAWWMFGPDSQQPDYESMRGRIQVVHEDGDWYRVSLVERGQTAYRHVKVSIVGGNVLIDDVR